MNDAFNYIAVLVSIVLGLCATLVMSQLSEAIQAHHRKHGYWVHTVWMVNLFIYLILEWWVFYRWHNTTSWNFFLLIWVTITPTLLYLAAGVLCPGDLESTDAKNWREYYYANRRGFFFIMMLLLAPRCHRYLIEGQTTLHRPRPALPSHLDDLDNRHSYRWRHCQ